MTVIDTVPFKAHKKPFSFDFTGLSQAGLVALAATLAGLCWLGLLLLILL